MRKCMVPCLYLQYEKAVTGFGQRNLFGDGDVEALAKFYGDNGADELLVFDFSSEDQEHEKSIEKIHDICKVSEIPVIAAGNIKETEDVKRLLYAGCAQIVLNFSKESNIRMLEKASLQFGKERMIVSISSINEFTDNQALIEKYADAVLALDAVQDEIASVSSIPVILHTEESREEAILELLCGIYVSGLSGSFISSKETEIYAFKEKCKRRSLDVQRDFHMEEKRSFREVAEKEEYDKGYSFGILQDIYDVLMERRENLTENFHAGKELDRTLRKIGEDCMEITIASKNQDKEEIKYRMSDLLYHIMLLMAEKGITWEEIISEISVR